MATNTRTVNAPPEKVWKVLSDGWLYPVWVVGASRMRGGGRRVAGHWQPSLFITPWDCGPR